MRKRGRKTWTYCLLPGTWSATQASALTGNRTGDVVVHRMMFSLLNHTITVLAFEVKTKTEMKQIKLHDY